MTHHLELEPILLRSIIDHVPCIIFVRDMQGKLILANKAYAQYFGYEPCDIEGHDQKDIYNKLGWVQPLIDIWLEEDRKVVSSGNPHIIEEFVNHRNGVIRKYQTSKYPLKLADGTDAVLVISHIIPEVAGNP